MTFTFHKTEFAAKLVGEHMQSLGCICLIEFCRKSQVFVLTTWDSGK